MNFFESGLRIAGRYFLSALIVGALVGGPIAILIFKHNSGALISQLGSSGTTKLSRSASVSGI